MIYNPAKQASPFSYNILNRSSWSN